MKFKFCYSEFKWPDMEDQTRLNVEEEAVVVDVTTGIVVVGELSQIAFNQKEF